MTFEEMIIKDKEINKRWLPMIAKVHDLLKQGNNAAAIDISLNLYTHVMTESKVEAMNDVK